MLTGIVVADLHRLLPTVHQHHLGVVTPGRFGRLAGQLGQRRNERGCQGQHLLAQGARAGDQPDR